MSGVLREIAAPQQSTIYIRRIPVQTGETYLVSASYSLRQDVVVAYHFHYLKFQAGH